MNEEAEETVTYNDGGNLCFGSSILIQRQGGYLRN